MAKDPAILFYTSDFLTGTFTMTDEQVGRYIKLLCLQHQKGILTQKDLDFVCRGEDVEVFAKFTKDEHGNFFNKTLRENAERRKAYSESRRNNLKKKEKKSPHMDKHMGDHMVSHMENENVIVNTIEERRILFIEVATEKIKTEEIELLNNFIDYWTESNENGKKMRFEMEKVFDYKKRFKTFLTNKKRWNGTGTGKQSTFEAARDY